MWRKSAVAQNRVEMANEDEYFARMRWLEAYARQMVEEKASPSWVNLQHILECDWREIPVEHWREPDGWNV